MVRFEQQLDPNHFLRIHRATIVNINKIVELRKGSKGEQFVQLESGDRLKISKARKKSVQDVLEKTG